MVRGFPRRQREVLAAYPRAPAGAGGRLLPSARGRHVLPDCAGLAARSERGARCACAATVRRSWCRDPSHRPIFVVRPRPGLRPSANARSSAPPGPSPVIRVDQRGVPGASDPAVPTHRADPARRTYLIHPLGGAAGRWCPAASSTLSRGARFAALDSEEFTQALKGSRPADAETARQLEEDEDQLKWLGRQMGGDPLRRPAFLAAIDEVETRIRQNRARLARQHRSAALAALPEDLDQLKELWDNIWDLDRKRALLDTLIEKVTVRPSTLGSKTGRKFDRSRARIVWRA